MPFTDEQLDVTPAQLVRIIRRLEKTIETLQARNKELEDKMREVHSSKAPHSKGTRKASPKPPGRKAGQGVFKRREAPVALPHDVVTEIDVPLEVDAWQCPDCQLPLEVTNELATILDIPAKPVRVITKFSVAVGCCPQCRKVIRGRHPQLSPTQQGANAHQLGPLIKTQALFLHYGDGLPLRKVPAVMARVTGICMTQSSLTQAACRLADPGQPLAVVYEQTREELQVADEAGTDDTGWRINAVLAFLMGFFTPDIAFYQIRFRHRWQEVVEALGADFKGSVGTDRGKSYEAKQLAHWLIQKCLSHILKNLSVVEATKSGGAKHLITQLKETFREGLDLWNAYHRQEVDLENYLKQGEQITLKLTHLLRERSLSDKDCERLVSGLRYQHHRGRLTLYLEDPTVEPTNNRSERGLRGAVIARKVSHCSKNERGARTYATFKTIIETVKLRTKNPEVAFAQIIQGKSMAEAVAIANG